MLIWRLFGIYHVVVFDKAFAENNNLSFSAKALQ